MLVNGFVFFDNNHIRHVNWGDDINYHFLWEISQRPIMIYNRLSLAMRLKMKNYLVIGSTIDMCCTKNTEIWGAGIINENKPLRVKPRKVHAVRGPLTRKKLLKEGIECPKIYGDPALLISYQYKPNVKKKYTIGFIPHISNLEAIQDLTVDGVPLSQRKDILVIDLTHYDKWTDIIDQICSCENITSGSLHGLIMAEAYGIPNLWIEFGKPLIGGHFKFHDFFLSIKRDRKSPYMIEDNELSIKDVNKALSDWEHGIIDLQPLINAAPFPIRI